ncbi:MAG: SCO family protein [Pirellulales bacterium]|nr:SCO family protein [Pirellulales bacterium]
MIVKSRAGYLFLVAWITPILWFASQATGLAQRREPVPSALKDVGVTEHLNAQIPMDLAFVDSDGKKEVSLKQFFESKKPMILTLNYSNCPMLCSLQLNGLFDALKAMPWDIGNQFGMITVSIDPLETPERARATKRKYLKGYGRAGSAQGYHCLTGPEKCIKELADSVGFHYTYSEETKQYAHAAVTMILTPDGHVSRYLYGVQYDPQTIRLSLLEAADGKIGSPMDQILLFCFHYDADKGRYGPAAFRLMQIGGGLTVLVLGCTIWIYRRREKSKKRSEETVNP